MPLIFNTEPYKKPSLLTLFWLLLTANAPALLVYFARHTTLTADVLGRFASANKAPDGMAAEIALITAAIMLAFVSGCLLLNLRTYRSQTTEAALDSFMHTIAAAVFWPGFAVALLYAAAVCIFMLNVAFAVAVFGFAAIAFAGSFPKKSVAGFLPAFSRFTGRLPQYPQNRYALTVYLLCATYFCWLFVFALYRSRGACANGGFDMGIYLGSLCNFAFTGRPTCSVYNGLNFFGEHFVPTMLLTAPFLRLYPHAATLQLLTTAAMAFSGVMLFKLTKLKTGSAAAGLVLVVCYFLHPFVNTIGIFDFYELFFAPLLLLCLFYFLENGNRPLFALMLVLVLGLREDMALTTGALGLYIFFGRKEYVRGTWIMALSGLYFIVAVHYIIPWFRGEEFKFIRERYTDLADTGPYTMGGIVTHLLANPVFDVTFVLGQPKKLLFLLVCFGPVLLLPFIGRRKQNALILFVPAAFTCLFSSDPYILGLSNHYTGYWVAPVFFCTVSALALLKNLSLRRSLLLIMLPVAFIFNFIFGFLPPCNHIHPIRDGFNSYVKTTPAADSLVQMLPPGVALNASENLLPLVVPKFAATLAERAFNQGYMLLDLSPRTHDRYPDSPMLLEKETREGKCHVIARRGYLILTSNKPVPNEKTAEAMQIVLRRFETESMPGADARADAEDDPGASAFTARRITGSLLHASTEPACIACGPNLDLPAGNYRIIYRLKTPDNSNRSPLAALDVSNTDSAGKAHIYARLQITPADFKAAGTYQNFIIPLHLDAPVKNAALRIFYLGKGSLSADYTEAVKE